MGWVAWTCPTALFWAAIAGLLACMPLLAALRPETPRIGMLDLATMRGDRLFLSLLLAAFIHQAWIGLVGLHAWGALAIALGVAVALFHWA